MSERTPEEALAICEHAMDLVVHGKTMMDHHLEEPIEGEALWPLSVRAGGLANDATVMAILDRREPVYRLHEWVKKAAQRLIAEDSGELRSMAYDKLLVTQWLCEGEPDPEFMRSRASAYPKTVPDDVEIDIYQALRLIDAGMLAAAREFLLSLKPQAPVLMHSTQRLVPVTALHVAIDHLEGKPIPEQYPAALRKLLARLRRSYFPRGNFALLVPWVRLYNRLFVGENDPWRAMAWLRSDPTKTIPLPACSR